MSPVPAPAAPAGGPVPAPGAPAGGPVPAPGAPAAEPVPAPGAPAAEPVLPRGRAILERGFYEGHPLEVAPRLLGKIIVRGGLSARIVEVEAYAGESDPASHAYRGLTPRSSTMFGPAGHLYVYFTYGMHHCANVVCEPIGLAGAVLLRAAEPLTGIEEMRVRRRARPGVALTSGDRDLCSGPGKLCQALGIDRSLDGTDICVAANPGGVFLCEDGTPPPAVATSTRVGLGARTGAALQWPWRFYVAGDPHTSRHR